MLVPGCICPYVLALFRDSEIGVLHSVAHYPGNDLGVALEMAFLGFCCGNGDKEAELVSSELLEWNNRILTLLQSQSRKLRKSIVRL